MDALPVERLFWRPWALSEQLQHTAASWVGQGVEHLGHES
jgi:hypothetical protein